MATDEMASGHVPLDVWLEVLSHLPPGDVSRFGQVNHTCRGVCKTAPIWETLRVRLHLPPPRKRAWKHKDSHSIVLAAACVKCRGRRRLQHQPLCLACMQSYPQLNSLRQDISSLNCSIRYERLRECHVAPFVHLGYTEMLNSIRYHAMCLVDELEAKTMAYAVSLNNHLSKG